MENIEEKNQSFTNINDVFFEKFPPEFDVDDFCDFLENSLNVKIKDYKKEGNNLICTLFTPKDVQILCSEIISFRKTTVLQKN